MAVATDREHGLLDGGERMQGVAGPVAFAGTAQEFRRYPETRVVHPAHSRTSNRFGR